MTSLLAKLRIVTLGNLHEMLDAMIDLNSPAAVKQYIRDLEAGIAQIEHAANTTEGALRTNKDDLAGAQRLASTLDADINALLTDKDERNDSLALPLQVKLTAANSRVTDLAGIRDQNQAMLDKLNGAISKLQAKHAQMTMTLESLESKVEAGEGMQAAAQAATSVGALSVDSPDVDSLARRINKRYNEQGAAFDRAMSKLATATDNDAAVASAEAALSRRKAELAEKKQTAGN